MFIEDQEGNRTDAPDGDYITSDNKTIVVVDGKVSEIRDPEAEVAPEEAPANEEEEVAVKHGRIATDKGELLWEGEEDLKAGDAVFVEGEEGLAPAPDGDVVVEGRVAEIRDPEAEVAPEESPEAEALRKENAELKEMVTELLAKCEKLSKMPLAEPAHEEVKASATVQKTGIKGLDRLAELMRK